MILFLAIVISFSVALSIANSRQKRAEEEIMNAYYEKERTANNVRKKSLDGLDYINVPLEFIPESLLPDNEEVSDLIRTLKELSKSKILNLTGISNTDLKLEYGTANINVLSKYDENYTVYARSMQRLSEIYFSEGYEANARLLLEKAIETRTDITAAYALLSDIYLRHEEYEKLRELLKTARSLNDPAKRTCSKAVLSRIPESEMPGEDEE